MRNMKMKHCLIILAGLMATSAAYAENTFTCPDVSSIKVVTEVGRSVYQGTSPDGLKVFKSNIVYQDTLPALTTFTEAVTEGHDKGTLGGVFCQYDADNWHGALFLQGDLSQVSADTNASGSQWKKLNQPVQYVCNSNDVNACPLSD